MCAKIAVIGAGFAGMAAATTLASHGHDVTVYEKHNQAGGRARIFREKGFAFDMGPSWYWMPDVFEEYFKRFGADINAHLNLVRLDPSYRVFFDKNEVDVPADFNDLCNWFESKEAGAAQKLREFMDESGEKYQIGMSKFVHKPSHSITEFAEWQTLKDATRLHLFTPFSKYIRKYFSDPQLLQLLEFPILFLGAKPEKTPALYSLMNYADVKLGTWYPMGGMHEIVIAMQKLAESKGVHFEFNAAVQNFTFDNANITSVNTEKGNFDCDFVVGAADYHHMDQTLLPEKFSSYSKNYWDRRTMSPSSLLFYLGVEGRVDNLLHHNLFFDEPFGPHADDIYDTPQWPEKPLFYVCCPSKTDPSVAPENCENIFLLMPVAPGISENPDTREHYFNIMMDRLEARTGNQIRNRIVFKRSYAHKEFIDDYSAFKGNAYGLANTLNQTAFLKPKMKSKKVNNLFFAGQLTTPGPGVPPSLISGQVAADEVNKLAHKTVLAHTS